MQKRGFYITLGGIFTVVISFVFAISLVSDMGFGNSEFVMSDIMPEMFDEVSEKTNIESGESKIFSFDPGEGTNSVFWGIQIIDYKLGDSLSILISNIYGDDLGKFKTDQQTLFETIKIVKPEVYNFNVQNTGSGSINVVMMFTKNPESSEKFSNPNSPLVKTLMPLAISGIVLIIGIMIIVIGIIILVIDYRKKTSRFN